MEVLDDFRNSFFDLFGRLLGGILVMVKIIRFFLICIF